MKRISSFTISVVVLLCVFLITGSISAAISATRVELRGQIANETDELGNDTLTLTPTLTARVPGETVAERNLSYSTRADARQLRVVKERFSGDAAAAAAAGLEGFGAGDMSAVAGSYMIVVWQAENYVVLKNKTNKLVRLLLEQYFWGEHKLLFEGDSWDVGGGWTLTAQSIDKSASPKQALLILTKDGIKKDEKVIFEKKIYTYVEKNLEGETDVPTFVTFVDGILPSETTDAVLLRYTWAIDTNVTTSSPGAATPEPRETPAYVAATATPKSTPGFEVVIAIVALGAISIIKRKRRSE